ncbi:hypothetical protein G7046_g2461 [Stylonectria norvegica]|nr:hypothetical protein G7046_g2461 [Stylonectria norvegica]
MTSKEGFKNLPAGAPDGTRVFPFTLAPSRDFSTTVHAQRRWLITANIPGTARRGENRRSCRRGRDDFTACIGSPPDHRSDQGRNGQEEAGEDRDEATSVTLGIVGQRLDNCLILDGVAARFWQKCVDVETKMETRELRGTDAVHGYDQSKQQGRPFRRPAVVMAADEADLSYGPAGDRPGPFRALDGTTARGAGERFGTSDVLGVHSRARRREDLQHTGTYRACKASRGKFNTLEGPGGSIAGLGTGHQSPLPPPVWCPAPPDRPLVSMDKAEEARYGGMETG